MSGSVAPYLALLTSEHNNKPNFVATVSALVQPFADTLATLGTIPGLYDLDAAVGSQLDTTGLWIGRTRNLSTPLVGVYFSFDTVGVGFDQGVLYQSFDPLSGLIQLPDAAYRTLLYATVAANSWNGTVPAAYTVWNTLFQGTGYGILIIDYQNMSMDLVLTGPTPDAVTLALFEGGYLSLKPAGVRINNFITPSVPNTPYFGFDVENTTIAGFDVGTIGLVSLGV